MIIAFNWTTENGVSYSIDIHPSVAIEFIGLNSAEIEMAYNTEHNVSVISSLCGRNKTNFMILHYG